MSRRPNSLDYTIWDQLFAVSTNSATTLQAQLRERVVAAILGGYFPTNKALPSCRELARYLGIARNTVVLAYECLVDEGYLIPRKGSGYYVNRDMSLEKVTIDPPQHCPPRRSFDWQRRLECQPSQHCDVGEPRGWSQYPYPFINEHLDPNSVPISGWRECCRETLSRRGIRQWVTDKIEFDDSLLVEQLRTRILPRRGLWASPEEILITVGAQHALYLVANLLITHTSTVGLEDPGCVDVRGMFGFRTSQLVGLPVDSAGLVVDERLDRCDYVYLKPSHQLPTTVTMSSQRRHALLERAAAQDIAIIEDDHESEISYSTEMTPALKSLDRDGRVIHIGSVSKSLIPGLCLGYVVGSPELIRELRALRRLMLRHPTADHQRAFAYFLARGYYDGLLYRLRDTYKARWQAMGESLAHHLPDAEVMPSSTGTACWVAAPKSLDTGLLQRNAMRQGILIEQGDRYFLSDRPPRHYFRLGFSSIPESRIEPGIGKLAGLIRQMASSGN